MKILVVDDHPLVREGLRDHLREFEEGAVILEAGDSAEALALVDQNPDLDLVLLDLNLPDAHGFSALTVLRERHPEIPVVVLSAANDRKTVLEALDKEAMGFIPKTAATPIILNALRLVLLGGVYLPPEVLNDSTTPAPSADARGKLPAIKTPADLGLSPRQAQILALIMQGKSNKIICRELALAESTVKLHITSILRALNVANRVQAVIAVGRIGLRLDTIKAISNNKKAGTP